MKFLKKDRWKRERNEWYIFSIKRNVCVTFRLLFLYSIFSSKKSDRKVENKESQLQIEHIEVEEKIEKVPHGKHWSTEKGMIKYWISNSTLVDKLWFRKEGLLKKVIIFWETMIALIEKTSVVVSSGPNASGRGKKDRLLLIGVNLCYCDSALAHTERCIGNASSKISAHFLSIRFEKFMILMKYIYIIQYMYSTLTKAKHSSKWKNLYFFFIKHLFQVARHQKFH